MDEERLLRKRVEELAARSAARDIPLATDFLTLGEQSIARQALREIGSPRCAFAGGYPLAERRLVFFAPDYIPDEELEAEAPIRCVMIEPANARFSEELGHRDYLGALMSLGIQRHVTGDIVLSESAAYLFCKEDIAEYLCDSLTEVRRTRVRARVVDVPGEISEPRTERIEGAVASPRLDALLALAFRTSRSRMVPVIEAGEVFVNGLLADSVSLIPEEGDIISVRHKGRFVYRGTGRETKKGRIVCAIDRYL